MDRPFIIWAVFTHGVIEIEDTKKGNTFKVNGQRLKPFLELRSPEIETTLLEDSSCSKRLSYIVESLVEDRKLSVCGRQPSNFFFILFYSLSFDFVCLFLFLLCFLGQVFAIQVLESVLICHI
jgi:hypothetical protein